MIQERVSLRGLRKVFGSRDVLNDLSIDIEAGEFMVVLGPSGCGKTTLLNLVAGLDHLDAGSIRIGARDVTALEPKKRNVAMVFQSLALYPSMTAGGNIGFALRMAGYSRNEVSGRVKDVAELLRIAHLLDRNPSELSGGERQRVAIGRALIRKPAVMLLDEPLSNLDSALRADLRAELKRLHQARGHTTLYVTHDQTEAMTLGTRVAVLDGGRVLQCDTPRMVYNKPRHVTAARLLGSPKIHFLEGLLVGFNHGAAMRGTSGAMLPLPGLEMTLDEGRPVLLGVRPEHVALVSTNVPDSVSGRVCASEMTGIDSFISIDLPMGRVAARLPADTGAEVGDEVSVRFEGSRVGLFCPSSGMRLN